MSATRTRTPSNKRPHMMLAITKEGSVAKCSYNVFASRRYSRQNIKRCIGLKKKKQQLKKT